MVSTRLQTGIIDQPKYDYPTLRLRGEDQTSSSSSSSYASRRGLKVSKSGRRSSGSPTSRSKGTVDAGDVKHSREGFWPSVVIGTNPMGMTEYEYASERIEEWRQILLEHERNHPLAVPQVKARLQQLEKERNCLENFQTRKTKVERTRARAREDRQRALRVAFRNSKAQAEKDNIRGALAAYEPGGGIGSPTQYTLIWGGKVVDVCDTYQEFTEDREERLNGYAKKYGPHWLWYEPPLEFAMPMKRFQRADRIIAGSLGSYELKMGFQKQTGLVTRSPEILPFQLHADNGVIERLKRPDGRVWCIGDGPRLVYNTVLDSGAYAPMLYQSDINDLGIHEDYYPAQCLIRYVGVTGDDWTRGYDIRVEIVDRNNQSLVDENDPTHPSLPKYVGAVLTVLLYQNGAVPSQEQDHSMHMGTAGARLSGVMPFMGAYVSSTPNNNTILFGEDRNDVLGFAKMPPARKWMYGAPQGHAWIDSHWIGDPMITFIHRGGELVDTDTARSVSRQWVQDPDGNEILGYTSDPAGKLDTASPTGPVAADGTKLTMDQAFRTMLFTYLYGAPTGGAP